MTLTLGIDLASSPTKTAVCAIEWSDDGGIVRLLCRGSEPGRTLHDKWLVAAIRGLVTEVGTPVKVAIDAPFGWPDVFIDALVAYRRGDGWPSGMDNPRAPFERRSTDRFVHCMTGKTALSVSADKIASTAMRCAVILSEVGAQDGWNAVDRAGTGLVCEAYPDPALRHWTAGHPGSLALRESYKGKLLGARRRTLTAILAERCPLHDPDGLLQRCERQDDHIDALVAALVARAAYLGQTHQPPTAEDRQQAAREGWIHLPAKPVSHLKQAP